MTKEISSADFQKEVLESEIPVLVDFFATWCGPCKMMAPIVDEISEERNDCKVVKIDVDENGEIAQEYGVMSIPTFISFKDGEVFAQTIGGQSKEDLLKMIP